MPKADIDYSNTIIYKIVCNDPSIKDLYIGHTTNFVQRKYAHKQTCNNTKSPYYNLKLYKTIRENGNWCNWEMTIVNFYNCKDHLEARQKEQEYFISLNATLNSIEPLPLKKSISLIPNPIDKKNINEFCCEKCDYICSSKFNLNRHNTTNKHQLKYKQTNNYSCNCGKIYKYSQGLSKHKQNCVTHQSLKIDTTLLVEFLKQNKKNEIIDKELMLTIMKENLELKTIMLNMYKNTTIIL
jgi:predicted GIY-YIG superfamily endonuclease